MLTMQDSWVNPFYWALVRAAKMNSLNPFIVMPLASLVILSAIYALWSKRARSKGRAKGVIDVLFLWPFVLRGRRTKREKVFLLVAVIFVTTLIFLSFFFPIRRENGGLLG